MGLILVFLLGMGNFAVHRAVLETDHPMLSRAPFFFRLLGGRFSLYVEFVMLLGTMLVVSQSSWGWVVFYASYTAVNAVSAWLILSGRI